MSDNKLHINNSPAARVGVFVDSQNINRSVASCLPGRRLHYKNFLERILAGRTLYCARIYDVVTEDFSKENFFQVLRRAGFEVLTKPVQVFSADVIKGDWDVGMVVDMITLSEKLDVVILASGDGDFLPAVNYLKHKSNCRVEGVACLRNTNSAIHSAFDSFIDLSDPAQKELFIAHERKR